MGKSQENKRMKMESLLNTSFELFTSQGINKTSISDIVEKAGVAKGTFYLYFKDKFDIRDQLIAHKSSQLFIEACHALDKSGIREFDERIVFIAEYILDTLARNKPLLAFIHKDLSWGIFKRVLTSHTAIGEFNFKEHYAEMLRASDKEYRDPEIMLFLIVELVGSAGFTAIIDSDPIGLTQLKPYLNHAIKAIITSHTA